VSDDPYQPAPGSGATGPQGWEAPPPAGEAPASHYPGGYPPPERGYQPPEGTNPGAYPGGAYPPPGTPGAPPYGGQPYGGQPYGGQPYGGQPYGGPPYGGPPPYGAYPGPMAPATSGWAIASLATGIASYVIVPFIGAIAAVIFGHIALNEIKNAQGRVEGRGMAIAGLVLGYVHFALVACAVLFVLVFVFGIMNSSVH
jgi:hypothetical protein